MKEIFILLLLALVAVFVNAGFQGISNAVKFHYTCGVDIPWYAAYFLDTTQCPSYGEKIASLEPTL